MCAGFVQIMMAEHIMVLALNKCRMYLVNRDLLVRINAQLAGDPKRVTGLGHYNRSGVVRDG